MKGTRRAQRVCVATLGGCLAVFSTGCWAPANAAGSSVESFVSTELKNFEELEGQGDNDSFATATELKLAAGAAPLTQGSIDQSDDVDIYDLGPVVAGDHLSVSVTGDGLLDAAAAVFDNESNLFYLNDDRNHFGGGFDPYIDFVFRRDSDHCFVAVAPSPGSRSTGQYVLDASMRFDAYIPDPQPQTVLLNFEGARAVGFAGRNAVNIPVFNAGDVDASLSGLTDELIEEILRLVREDFVGMNVEVYSSRSGFDATDNVTTIHFGAYDPALLGVAENVDEFNERVVQEAVVFTDTFQVFNILEPTLDEYAQALANVTSHEIGHLLGLVHTTDVRGIMDITASLRQLLRNQAFSRSALVDSTFPIGFQNAPEYLMHSVGGDLERVLQNSADQLAVSQAKTIRRHFDPKTDAIPRPVFSSCGD